MKNRNWLLLALFSVAAAALRAWQCLSGFDENGLPIPGSLPGILLPVALALALASFAVLARALPGGKDETGRFSARFSFQDAAPASCVVAGAFGILAASLLSLAGGAIAVSGLLLALFGAAAAAGTVYLVAALRRGAAFQPTLLLLPVCAVIVFDISLFLSNNSDPVLAGS